VAAPPGRRRRRIPSSRRWRTLEIDLGAFVTANAGTLVAVLAIVVVAVLLLLVVALRRVGRLGRRIEQLTRGSDESSLEAVLGQHLERVRKVVREVDAVSARTAALETEIRGSLGRVGLVRYNPFDDTGGNQSFALAILDADGNGFVVSSLHARAGTRVYAKAVSRGGSDTALSDEESEALKQALARPGAAAAPTTTAVPTGR
jgi:Na+-transporting methylmalonyl-CoA/oxaloacetate decarboxylase gamma subunit